MIVQEIVNAVLQISVALLIGGLVYFLSGRKKEPGFSTYLGFSRPPARAMGRAVLAAAAFSAANIALFSVPGLGDIYTDPDTITGQLKDIGFGGQAIALILVVAFFKTSLSEEILFRGLIAKRLIARLGFRTGNMLQAAIFGAVHVAIIAGFSGAGPVSALAVMVFLLSGAAGWVFAFLNERAGQGSILPGWLAHALLNTAVYSVFAFLA